jgi:hypothetical protein
VGGNEARPTHDACPTHDASRSQNQDESRAALVSCWPLALVNECAGCGLPVVMSVSVSCRVEPGVMRGCLYMSPAAMLRGALFVEVVIAVERTVNGTGPDQPAPRESVRRVKDGTRGVEEGVVREEGLREYELNYTVRTRAARDGMYPPSPAWLVSTCRPRLKTTRSTRSCSSPSTVSSTINSTQGGA